MSTRFVLAAVLATAGLTSCHNSRYCEGNYVGNDCDYPIDADGSSGSDASTGCTSDQDCTSPTPACDVDGSKMCVQCIAPADTDACTGMTPVCGSDDACHACTSHAQCTSDVCLPDGSCDSGSDVAYVAAGGSGSACTQAVPCGTMANALATVRPYIKASGSLDEQVSIDNQAITILADPSTKLTYSSPGVILTITGTSTVSIFDLEIDDGLGATGVGISMPTGNMSTVALERVKVDNCDGGGVVTDGGTLSIERSTISGNTGGGISISAGAFTLENNFVVANGAATSAFGGVKIDAITTTGTHQFDFNTISANVGPATVDTGVLCGTVTVPLTLDSNIIYANSVSSGGHQLGGSTNCGAIYSDIGPDGSAGSGNINADPVFVSTTESDYHLTSGSPCIDVADPAATLDVDFDGDTRPQGSGRDIGADEYKP